ncbi:hypothetical protein [Streptomyces goshikiensis]|uniref:hypothetical protein n=1 Tax=Streptomyces goshikiensis TaxID=1942 RepID=UPI0036843711
MSQGWKITVIVLAVAGIVSTPLVWLLDGPDTGQMVGAAIQAAAGIAALVWAVFQRPTRTGPTDHAVETGEAEDGGVTGIRRRGGQGQGAATAERTGDARGDGSVSGIDYTP